MTANVSARDRADAGGEAVHAVEEVDHVHHRDDPDDRQRDRRPTPGRSTAPTNGNVKWSIQTPNAVGDRGREDLARELRQRASPRKSSTAPDDARDRGAEQDAAHLAREVEERERRDEDPEEDRQPTEPRDRPLVEPARVRAGRRRRGGAPCRRPPGVSSTTMHERDQRARTGPRGSPAGRRTSPLYFVPYSRSPASPSPGRCSPSRSARGRSQRRRSRRPDGRGGSARSPPGAAISAISRTDVAPAAFTVSTAAAVELPVASIGSSRITSRSAMSFGQLHVVLDGLERLLVAVQADEPDAGARDQREHAVEHPHPRPQDRADRDLLAGDPPARSSARAASRSRPPRRRGPSSPRR